MSRAAFLAGALLLTCAACTPSLNWRETTLEGPGLHAMFPCKPDQADRQVELSPGRRLTLHAVGCEAAGATFVVLYGNVGDAPSLADALVQWKKASIATTRATAVAEQAWQPAGALGLGGSALVRASGQSPDGQPLQSHAAYFARGTSIFQAVIYARAVKPEMAEPFFAGLRFQP